MSDSASNQGTRMLGAGLTLVVTVGLFAYGGHVLDDWAATSPLFLLIGVLLGVAGGFIHLFSVVAPGMLPWGRSRTAGHAKRSDSPPDTGRPDRDEQDPSPRPPQP